MADLRKHQDTHSTDPAFRCQVTQCDYTARGYQSLANHFKKVHQVSGYCSYGQHGDSVLLKLFHSRFHARHLEFLQTTLPPKVRKKAKIRNQHNQAPHLTQDMYWKVTNTQENITNRRALRLALSQQVTTRLDSIAKTDTKLKRSTKEVLPWNGQ